MRLFFFLVVSIGVCSSCNNTSETKDVTDAKDNSAATSNTTTTQCYLGLPGKDSIFLQLHIDNDKVSGDLEYKRFQKDRNKGTIEGIFRGDTLLADYAFMSEGIISVREVIFLKKGDVLIEGFGDVEEKNKKMVFKNTGEVKFDEAMLLKQSNCGNE